MATQDQVFAVRLQAKDPIGVIAIVSVANVAALPTTPKPQTLYYLEDLKEYRVHNSVDWVNQEVKLSDLAYSAYIDAYGENQAVIRALKEIMRSLAQELYIAQHNSGAESVVFQNLTTMANFYKSIIGMAEEDDAKGDAVSTGRMFRTHKPIIGGVMECR